jgi:L-fuconolactonase
VLFGSDWPVVTQAASYTTWVETVEKITNDFSDKQKDKLWKQNAVRFYRLEDED